MKDKSTTDKKWRKREHQSGGAISLLGIANLKSSQSLALAVADPAQAAAVMRWDIVNPWARFYQLNSTHPLTALRVRALNMKSESMHQKVHYPLPESNTTDASCSFSCFPSSWRYGWLHGPVASSLSSASG
jgi:hypothetical protein